MALPRASKLLAACAGLVVIGACTMEATAGQPRLMVTPQRLESDALRTLKPIGKSRKWDLVKPALEKMGYSVFHDRVDKQGEYTVTVGWDKAHKTFRSYKLYIQGGMIISVKADYAYPAF